MTDEPRIISTEKDLQYARTLETSDELDAMVATIRALWKERDSLTNLGCKAVDLTSEISESAGKEIADLRAMVDTEIKRVVELCRGEVDAVFIKTPHAVATGTIERISKRLHEKLGQDTLCVLLEGDATVEALNEEEMRELGWVRFDRSETDVFACPECKAEHSRGPLDPLSGVYRCLGCGYVGPRDRTSNPAAVLNSVRDRLQGILRRLPPPEETPDPDLKTVGVLLDDVVRLRELAVDLGLTAFPDQWGEDEWIPCPECGGSGVGNTPGALACEDVCTRCAGKGRVHKNDLGPGAIIGDVKKGPVDMAKTVESPEDLTSKIMTDFQLFDGLNRITPEAIKATEGREFDFVDTHGGVYRGTVESVEVDPSGDFANLTLDIPEGIPNSEIRPFLGVRAMIAVDPRPSIKEYPREVVCLNCDEVVAYATAAAVPGETMKAEDVVRTDGTRPGEFDIVCRTCGADDGGPFWLRDRETGEWIGEPPPRKCR